MNSKSNEPYVQANYKQSLNTVTPPKMKDSHSVLTDSHVNELKD